MGLASPGPADDLRQFLTPSVSNGDLVTFPGPPLGLLAGPGQAMLADLADMLGVEADLEMTFDELGDACGGPQLGAPPVSLGPWVSSP